MGNAFASLLSVFRKPDAKLVMIGLDAAGKTTLLYMMHLGEVVSTIPTMGFNVETLHFKNLKFTVWDVAGGGDKLRPLWRHYYEAAQAVVFVVDSNDRDRIDQVCYEVKRVIADDDLRDVPLLVFANKQDLPNALSPEEVTDKLGLRSVARDWYVQPACATTGEGLYEGFEWLSAILKAPKKSW